MAYEITWAPKAQDQLDYIIRSVEDDSSMTVADRLEADIMTTIDLLRHTPLLGGVYEQSRFTKAREIFCHRYRIFYRVLKPHRRIEIIALWHGSRQEPDFL